MLNIVDYTRYEAQQGKSKSLSWEDACGLFAVPKAVSAIVSKDIDTRKPELDAEKHAVGFVFWGSTRDGRKRKQDIINHSAVALDYDDIKSDKDTFTSKLETALDGLNYMYYSTTKCTDKDLRLRVIIPLSASVSGDKYQAVARAVINKIGTDGIDNSTLQDNRAMGYTVRLADADYIYHAVTDKSFLDVDAFLKESYTNWMDVSEWLELPEEKKVKSAAARRVNTANNNGKPVAMDEFVDVKNLRGVEGAFCRTYSVEATIDAFLPDVYTKARGDRYTYVDGQSTGGLVIFGANGGCGCYSHHSTDPAGNGMVLNAFDLVRIHRYGQLDKDGKEYASKNKLPSYTAMKRFALEMPEIKRALNKIAAPLNAVPADIMSLAQAFFDTAMYPANDYGVASMLSVINRGKIAWAKDARVWLWYDGIRWLEVGAEMILGCFPQLVNIMSTLASSSDDGNFLDHAAKVIDLCQKTNNQKAAMEQAKSMLSVKRGDMDGDIYTYNTPTNCINLKALFEGGDYLLPHKHTDNCMMLSGIGIDADFEPDKGCLHFLETLIPDPEVRLYLQMYCGYCLTGSTAEKVFVILHAQKGNNGKTTFTNLLRNAFGDYCTIGSDSMILTNKFGSGNTEGPSPMLASLAGARVCLIDEIGQGRKLESATVKRITGSAPIKCRKLRQDPIEFIPRFKLIISANDTPRLQDANDSAMRIRVRIIPFDQFFSKKAGNLDPDVEWKIETPEWKKTFLNWCMEGLALYKAQGHLDDYAGDMDVRESNLPTRMKQALLEYYDESDDIGDFLDTFVDVTHDPRDFLSSSELYDLYTKENRNNYNLNQHVFAQQVKRILENAGLEAGKKRQQDESGYVSNRRGWFGVKWLSA